MASVVVSSAAALNAALASATTGETILLAPGTYQGVTVQNINVSGVTVTSEYASNTATLAPFYIKNSSGLTFSNLTFSVAGSTDPTPFRVYSSQNITLTNLQVHDSALTSTTNGILVADSQNVAITNSSFSYLNEAVKQSNDNGLTVSGNTFTNITADGIDGGGTSNLTVTDNLFTDFQPIPGGEHPDAVQVWTTGTTTSASNITISGNVFVRGSGGAIQGVNVEDEVGTLPYQNVTVTNNLLIGGLNNGVYVQDASNVQLANNQVLGYADDASRIDVLEVAGAALSGNVSNGYIFSASGYTPDTGVTETNDTTAGAVMDGGAAALKAWLAANPQFTPALTSELSQLLAPMTVVSGVYANTAFQVTSRLDALNASTSVSSVVISDNAALVLSAGQLQSDAHALSMVSNADGTSYSIAVGDTAANIAANFDALNANSHVASIMVGDFGWVRLTAAQLTSDGAALGKLTTPGFGVAATVYVNDTAANITAALPALNALAASGVLKGASLTNAHVLSLSAAQASSGAAVLKLLSNGTVAVADTAANISADLSALSGVSTVTSLTVTDSGTVTVSNSNYAADLTMLGHIAGAHSVEILGYGGNASLAEVYTYDASGALVSSSSLTIATSSGASTVAPKVQGDFLGDSKSSVLIESTSGAVVVGQLASSGQLTYSQIGGLGSAWSFDGSGDYLGDGKSQFLLENTNGAVVAGEVGATGQATYASVARLGAEWRFVGSGDFLGLGHEQFLIENTNGAMAVGTVGSTGQATFSQVGGLGASWAFVGAGDFYADGKTQFLIENTTGAVVVGEVGSNGQAIYTQVGALGSEWKFVGSGDFLGDGKDQFLVENTKGAVAVGEVGANGQATYTQVAGLGTEWKFVGAGDYSGTGVSSFLIENTTGAIFTGTIANGHAQYTQVSGLGGEWSFKG